MNRQVNTIAGRLSLRPPQRESLEILDRITEIVPPSKTPDVAAALAAISSEYPKMTAFERDFPSVCFALATGVGKPWEYALIPHDIIADNMTVAGLVAHAAGK